MVLRDLRRAIEADDGVAAAVDDTLDLISVLDGQCQDVLASDGGSQPD